MFAEKKIIMSKNLNNEQSVFRSNSTQKQKFWTTVRNED